MRREEKYKQVVLETYDRMFKASEPALDFDNYIHTTSNYEDENGNKIVLDRHLTLEEMHDKRYRIDVPYEKHFIDKEVSENIISEVAKKYKLDNGEKSRLRTQVYLGCAPTFKHNESKNVGEQCQ